MLEKLDYVVKPFVSVVETMGNGILNTTNYLTNKLYEHNSTIVAK